MQDSEKFSLEEVKRSYLTYFTWAANVVMPVGPGGADGYLLKHWPVILHVARELLQLIAYVPEPIFRGILLKEPVDTVPPHDNLTFLSFSADRKQAERFANIKSFRSHVHRAERKLGTHGHIITYTPHLAEVLFHYQLLSILPFAEAFSLIGLDGSKEVEGLMQQKEIVILQPQQPFTNVARIENAACPSQSLPE